MTMTLKTMDGGTVELAPEALQSFRSAFRGLALTPEDAAYDELRRIRNAKIDRRPRLIGRCTGIVDVVQTVRFATPGASPAEAAANRRTLHPASAIGPPMHRRWIPPHRSEAARLSHAPGRVTNARASSGLDRRRRLPRRRLHGCATRSQPFGPP